MSPEIPETRERTSIRRSSLPVPKQERTRSQGPAARGRSLAPRRNTTAARRRRESGCGVALRSCPSAPPCRRGFHHSWGAPAGPGARLPWPGRRSRGRARRPVPGLQSGGTLSDGAGRTGEAEKKEKQQQEKKKEKEIKMGDQDGDQDGEEV